MSDQKMKADAGKVPLDLLPVRPLEEIAKVLAFGAKKYEARRWEKGIAWSRIYGATLRHMLAWWRGEDNDPETGLSHLAHAGCEVLFALEFVLRGRRDLDDRPEPPIEVSGGTEPAPPPELPRMAKECKAQNPKWPHGVCLCTRGAGHNGNHWCTHGQSWPQS